MTPPRRLDPAALERVVALAREQVAAGEVPFAIVAVASAEGVVLAEAIPGPAAAGVHPATICAIASITKPIIATAIMQLVAEGRVRLDDAIDRYVPEFAAGDRPAVTIWHLLGHTSGLPDYDLDELLASRPDRATLLRWIATADLRFVPGSRYEYISSSFELLAAVIERARGEPLEAALRRMLLDPLGMADTTFAPRGEQLGRVVLPVDTRGAAGHADTEPGWASRPARFDEARYLAGLTLGGGGLLSTAGDLVRFGRAMLRGGELDGARVLPPAFVELMTREQTRDGFGAAENPIASAHYALGWGKPSPHATPGSASAFGHRGASGTALWVDPAHDLVVAYVTAVLGLERTPSDAVIAAAYAALREG